MLYYSARPLLHSMSCGCFHFLLATYSFLSFRSFFTGLKSNHTHTLYRKFNRSVRKFATTRDANNYNIFVKISSFWEPRLKILQSTSSVIIPIVVVIVVDWPSLFYEYFVLRRGHGDGISRMS